MTGKNITEGFDPEFGRLDIRLGSTPNPLTPNVGNGQVIGIARYIDPPTEMLNDSEVILWRIAHLGVDSHSLHFHLFDLQVVNHVDYTNVIKPPYPDELGWREVIRTNPMEDIIVAIKPRTMALPFPIPRSNRLLDVTNAVNVNTNFLPIAPPVGIAAVPQITNSLTDFGWEYVWHCHLLAHEENDMMRPMCLQPPTATPPAPVLGVPTMPAGQVNLAWTEAATFANQTAGFRVLRCSGSLTCTPTTFATLNDRDVRTYADTSVLPSTIYRYRVRGFNNVGNGTNSGFQTVTTAAFGNPTVTMTSPASGATFTAPATIPLVASATTGTGATITNVAFFFGTNLISTATVSPYTVNWASVPAGVYSVDAKVTNSQGVTAMSAPISVVVKETLPPAPLASSPTGTGVSATAGFVFNAVAGATNYQIWLQDYTTNTGGPINFMPADAGCATGAHTCGFTMPTPLIATHAYGWQVAALNSAGQGPWSNLLNFDVAAGPGILPIATVASSPTGTGIPSSTSFTWNAEAGATGYLIWLNNYTTSAGGPTMVTPTQAGCASGTGVCSFAGALAVPLVSTNNYGWQVAVQNSVGQGPWSNALNFTVL
jgi:hypothetical protein